MNRSTQWLSLVAGLFILGFGVMKLYEERDWVLFILGLLIVAFSISKVLRSREGNGAGPDRKNIGQK